MQLTHVFLNRSLPPIAVGGQTPIKMFCVGMKCNDAYGGGVIASINQERNGTIVVRKDRPFSLAAEPGKPRTPFDFVAIFPGGSEYAYGLDEVVKGQGKAAPACSQNNSEPHPMQQLKQAEPAEQKAQGQQQAKGK